MEPWNSSVFPPPGSHGPSSNYGTYSPMPGGVLPYSGNLPPCSQPRGPGSTFLNLFGDSELSLQEIADRAHQLQQKIDENAEQEKASLRTAAEQKHLEIERHAAELSRHAASSIEAYKSAQLQTAERQKAYQQAVARQQADQAKKLIDQQAAQAIAAVETRERHVDLERQQQDLMQRNAPAGFMQSMPPLQPASPMLRQGAFPVQGMPPMGQLPPPGSGAPSPFDLGGLAGMPLPGPWGAGPGFKPPSPLPHGGGYDRMRTAQ